MASGDITAKAEVEFAFMGRYSKTVEATSSCIDGRDTSKVKPLKEEGCTRFRNGQL